MHSRSSLRLNVLANYGGQLYVAAISLLLLPFQLRLIGTEAYGLVGFFGVLCGWLQLLDVGLSPTLARETARYRAGTLDGQTYGTLMRTVEWLFLLLGLAVSASIYWLSEPIAETWLHPESLSAATVAGAVAVMGVVFALRWQATLSRSVLIGLESLVWLNALSVFSATLRSAGVLLVLRWVEPTPRAFFLYQGGVAVFELIALRLSASRLLCLERGGFDAFDLASLRRVAPFSLSVAFAAVVWAFLTQLDKLLLSSILPLSEYAWFSLAVTAAMGINLLAAPIGQAVQPRLTSLYAEGNLGQFRATYSDATQMLSAVALTASLALAGMARPVLWAWMGDTALANRVAPVLALYSIGNGLLAVVSMTYYLQVACGDLRLHVKGNVAFAVLLVPAVAVAAVRGGMLGAAIAWCGANGLYLVAWSAAVHRRFLPGIGLRWLAVDAVLPSVVGALPLLAVPCIAWATLSRFQTVLAVGGVGLAAVSAAALATRPARRVAGSLQRLVSGGRIAS